MYLSIYEKGVFRIFTFIIIAVFMLFLQGCKKPESTRIIFTIEGELFSDASALIDGKTVGRFMQTLIRADGTLYINGIYNATLPPGHRDVPEQEAFTGTLDPIELPPGKHTVLFITDDGKTLQVNMHVKPGQYLITYFSDEWMLGWNDTKIKAVPNGIVTITLAQ